MIIYSDTQRELYFKDYKPLPDLSGASLDSLKELLNNLYNACENAFLYGSALLEIAVYDDIEKVQALINKMEGK